MAEDIKEVQPTVRELLEENIAAANNGGLASDLEKDRSQIDADSAADSLRKDREDRLRDEAGRFAKTDQKTSTTAEPAKTAPLQDATTTAAVVEPQPIPRPSSWKKEMWPLWDKLTMGAPLSAQEARQVAEYNAQREQQFAAGVSTYKSEADRAKPIMEVLSPYEGELQRINLSAPQMVHQLMTAHTTLAHGSPQEKMQLFSQLMQNYGVPLAAFYDQNTQQQYLQSAPARQALPQAQPDINSLVEQVIQTREAKQTIAGMEKDAQKYPFFQYVRGTMAQLLETGVTTDLDDAYQQALQAPEHSVLTTFMHQQHVKDEEQRKLEAQQKAAKVARANVVSPKSATPMSNGSTTNSKPSVREALTEAMSAHLGSARV